MTNRMKTIAILAASHCGLRNGSSRNLTGKAVFELK